MEENYERIMGQVYAFQERFTNEFSEKMKEIKQNKNYEYLDERMLKFEFAIKMIDSQKEIIEFLDDQMKNCTENEKERLQKEKNKFVEKKIEDEEMTINALKNLARDVEKEKEENEKRLNDELIKLQEQKTKAIKRVEEYSKREDVGYNNRKKANLIKEQAINKIQGDIEELINKQKSNREKFIEFDEKISNYSRVLNIESDIEKIKKGEEKQISENIKEQEEVIKNNNEYKEDQYNQEEPQRINSIDKEEFSNNVLKNIRKREKEENLNNDYFKENIDNLIDNNSNEVESIKIRDRIFVTINEGKIQYQYENDEENIGKYDLREFKEVFSDMKDNIKNVYDPFLRQFLKERNDRDRLNLIKSSLDYGGNLKSLKEEFLYDMAGAEDLGFRARRQLRKVVKIVKKLNLKIQNEECTKFSFKNDILRGISDLFKGTMKGLKGPEERLLIEESYKRRDKEIVEDSDKENQFDVKITKDLERAFLKFGRMERQKNELDNEYKLREESKKDQFGNSTEKTQEDIENEQRYKQNVEARNNVETRNNEENVK